MLEDYNGIPGWYRHADFFKWCVDNAPEKATFVEVGVLFGAATCGLAQLISDSGKRINHIVVDLFDAKNMGKLARQVMNDLHLRTHREAFEHFRAGRVHEKSLVVLQGDSRESADRFKDKTVNMVFLDTKHDANHVASELRAWLPKVKPGGMLAVKTGGIKNGEYVDHPGAREATKWLGVLQGFGPSNFDRFVTYTFMVRPSTV